MRELRFAVEHNPDYPSASRRTRQTAAEGVTLPRKRQGRSQPFGIVIGCVSPVLQGHRLANESENDPVSGSLLARGVDPTSAFMGRAMGETQADVHRCCSAKKATVCCNPAARGVVRHPSKARSSVAAGSGLTVAAVALGPDAATAAGPKAYRIRVSGLRIRWITADNEHPFRGNLPFQRHTRQTLPSVLTHPAPACCGMS